MHYHKYRYFLACSICSIALAQTPAWSQDSVGGVRDGFEGDIVVTARKREETLMSVPVAVSAISGSVLENRGVNSMDALARMVPQLVVGEGGGTYQGGNIVLRGVSGADSNPFGDQAVSFNLDGLQVARASVRRMAGLDIERVEVLKGPQALLYGKNSPGGVISIRTADPTPDFQARISGGYEFEAREWRADGYISGPITDTLGFRVAAYGSTMKGWVKNIVPSDELLAPTYSRAPRADEYVVRGTLLFQPSDVWSARLKVTYNESEGDQAQSNVQFVKCPYGTPQLGGQPDCKPDNRVQTGSLGTALGEIDPRFGDGSTFMRQSQFLTSLELNADLNENLAVTSLTGFYKYKFTNRSNSTASYIPATLLPAYSTVGIEEFSQEVRLASAFDSPVNFLIGGFFQTSSASAGISAFMGALPPLSINNFFLRQKGKAYSAFAQLVWDITPNIELDVGGRYSYEKKRLPETRAQLPGGAYGFPPPPVATVLTEKSWNDFSPEVTLSYRPTSNLTLYGSYKHGFLSGGFNSGAANFALPIDYGQQTIKGFESGVKATALDGALRATLDLYSYKIKGLQVQVTTQGNIQELKNAAGVTTKGGEFELHYSTPVRGLSVHGTIAYDRGRYTDYFASCYRGQSKALGCGFVPLVGGQAGQAQPAAPGQNGSLQKLTGSQLVRTPEWAGNVGFLYETPIFGDLKIGFTGDMTFSDSYYTDPLSNDNARSPSYKLLDASIRVSQADNRWEVAVIGRNLTDKHYWTRGSDTPFTGTAPGNETGPSVLADTIAAVSRGREIMLRVSTKF
ncbi:iron complex outermembrane recepter protein [Sphingobium faniae]|nr:iron complex outermembrane recepter protein [Sphingobium faniae]